MEKLTDPDFSGKFIARKIKAFMENNWVMLIDVSQKLWVSHSNVSMLLSWRMTTSNTARYEKIAMAAWMSAHQFSVLVDEAKRASIENALWKEWISEDFALKSLVWNSPEAQAEAKSVIQYIKQKYGLK